MNLASQTLLNPDSIWERHVAPLGLYLFALGYVPSKALANIGLGLLLIAFLFRLKHEWTWLKADPLLRLSVAWLVFLLAMAIWASIERPATLSQQFDSILEMFSFGLIPLMAWATRGDPQRITITLGLALAGMSLRLLWEANWGGSGPLFDYHVTALGIGKNAAGVMIDAGIVGIVLLLLHRLSHWNPSRWRAIETLPLLFLLVLLALYLVAWSANLSRATWGSLTASMFIIIAILTMRALRGQLPWQPVGVMVLTLALAGIWIVLQFGEHMGAKLFSEPESWQALLAGDWGQMPQTSIGLRFHMWNFALEAWLAHPIFGLGLSVGDLLLNNENPHLQTFNQFHSGYIELLLRTGLAGVIFYIFAGILVYRTLKRALNAGIVPFLLYLFLLDAFVIFALNNLSNSFIFFQHGWQYIVLFGGIAYGYRWRVS